MVSYSAACIAVLLACVAEGTTTTATGGKIDTVVILMEENRSFDHLLGWMKKGGPFGDTRVDGLTGNECNAIDFSKPLSPTNQICVNDLALDRCPYDPNHSHNTTTGRIYACQYDKTPGTPCTEHGSPGVATMGGFVQNAIWDDKKVGKVIPDGRNEMSMWPSEKVPILTTLAKQFANFDNFFSDFPGCTYPNRQFVNSGTAGGHPDNGVPQGGYTQKTIFRLLEENNKTWTVYYEDTLTWINFFADIRRPEAMANIKDMSEFYEDAEAGRLSHYTFIEPRIAAHYNKTSTKSYGLANHQHPSWSVMEGERLMKHVYEAVRQGPKWNSSLLMVTYDEHGGFYDHVPPPDVGVPSPDGINSADGFNYERLGVRVPTVAISPWIPAATLVHSPSEAQKQQNTSQWSLSSILATTQKLLGLKGGPLTKRDAWSATFEDLLSLDTPRTDCPWTLPDVPPPPRGELERQLEMPLDEHGVQVIRTLCELVGYDHRPSAQAEVAPTPEEEGFCQDLGVCVEDAGTEQPCGHGLYTSRQFSVWREAMWKLYLNKSL